MEVICIKPTQHLKKNEIYTVIEQCGFHCNCGTILGYYVGKKTSEPSPVKCTSCGAQFHTTDRMYFNSERFEKLEYNSEQLTELLKQTI